MQLFAIYGAKSLAVGVFLAIRELYPECMIEGFIVKSLQGNQNILQGLPVCELRSVTNKQMHILIATPEDMHDKITVDLEEYGFLNYTCIDSKKEAELMQRYFTKIGRFPSIHLMKKGYVSPKLCVYMAKHHKDKVLKNKYKMPDWICPILVGAVEDKENQIEVRDDIGENISHKNVNYCELTALYWIWKNKIKDSDVHQAEYYGLFQYRRVLDIGQNDILRLRKNDIDVILPYPTIHEPNIFEHHTRYLKETDWEAMCRALKTLQPKYAEAFSEILLQPYLYNYNMLIAKKTIFSDYCEWLFPILELTEKLTIPQGCERADRYIGYMGENLLTLYFMYHQESFHIVHAGRNMYT